MIACTSPRVEGSNVHGTKVCAARGLKYEPTYVGFDVPQARKLKVEMTIFIGASPSKRGRARGYRERHSERALRQF